MTRIKLEVGEKLWKVEGDGWEEDEEEEEEEERRGSTTWYFIVRP